MPAVKVVDFNGQDAGEMELSNVVFDAPLHVPAMHQVVVAHMDRFTANGAERWRNVRGNG